MKLKRSAAAVICIAALIIALGWGRRIFCVRIRKTNSPEKT